MVALIQRLARYEVYVDSVFLPTQPGLVINESLDALTAVAEFSLAARPDVEPAELDRVRIIWRDLTDDTAFWAFGGSINAIEVTSQPWSMVCRCVDSLEKLRRVPTSDHDLTGMTDREAVMHLLDSCDVNYDPDDILGTTYELGQIEDVKWQAGQPASTVLAELDEVFGFHTRTVMDDRVVRFSPALPPSTSTGSIRTYKRGSNASFGGHVRGRGDRDRIQSYWTVQGLSYASGPDEECNSTVWAQAIDANPQLGGRRVRTAPQTVSSDFIQHQSLAEAIVRRKMRLTNRLADERSVVAFNDPRIHPGSKIGLIDPTYGVGDADVVRATVTSVDRTGPSMTLNVVAGEPGDEGTVSSGTEQVCNDEHTGGDDGGGGFEEPDTGVPPIDPGGDLDLPDPPPLEPVDPPEPENPDDPFICDDLDPGEEQPAMGEWVVDDFESPWRRHGTWRILNADGEVPDDPGDDQNAVYWGAISGAAGGSPALYLNDQLSQFLQSAATDTQIGQGRWTFTIDFAFVTPGSTLRIQLRRWDGTPGSVSGVTLYAEPGQFVDPGASEGRTYDASLQLQYGQAFTNVNQPAGPIGGGGLSRNTGMHFPEAGGAGFAVSGPSEDYSTLDYHTVSFSIDIGSPDQEGELWGDVSGKAYVEKCVNDNCLGGPVDYSARAELGHAPYKLVISCDAEETPPLDRPWVVIKTAGIGVSNCRPNPDYVPPDEPDDEGQTGDFPPGGTGGELSPDV